MNRRVRILLVYAVSPAILAMIAMIVIVRPLTAYQDGFHGPEEMWRDIRAWAHTGLLRFPSWQHATRGHLRHHRTS
jgi:hypothetical protein